MLKSIQASLGPVISIFLALAIPFLLITRFIRKAKKERETPWRKKKRKKFKSCYDSATLLGLETDLTIPNETGPIAQTLADALGFTGQQNSEPGPNGSMTIGDVLGPLRGDKRCKKWMITVVRAVARMSCRDAKEPSEPLIKEADPAVERRKIKKRRREKRGRDEGLGLCHVCSQRSKNSTLVPCGHAYCRVCSREIWINARCCPVCSAQIVEVLDTF